MENWQEDFSQLSPIRKDFYAGLESVLLRSGDQYVVFLPSLNLTAYGDTEAEADEMLQVVIQD